MQFQLYRGNIRYDFVIREGKAFIEKFVNNFSKESNWYSLDDSRKIWKELVSKGYKQF